MVCPMYKTNLMNVLFTVSVVLVVGSRIEEHALLILLGSFSQVHIWSQTLHFGAIGARTVFHKPGSKESVL